MRGKYSDCGKVFGKLFSKLFLRVIGKSMLLTYDTECRENDADFEPLFSGKPGKGIGKNRHSGGIGGRFFTLIHKGP